MIGRHVVIAAVVALPVAFALMTQTSASGRGPLMLAGQGSATEARFGLDTPADGPFPSDWFTVPDYTNITHRRIALPMPDDCSVQVSDCADVGVLNTLDGFNLQPRLSVPFSGPIDLTTVTADTVFLVSLGKVGPGQDYMPWGTVVNTDQVVWDPSTNTLHVESDELLAQDTRFALIVTRGIRDANGAAIEASNAFRRFRAEVRQDYKQDLLDGLRAAREAGVSERDIAAASVFTTESATAVLEKIRDQIHAATPAPADFGLGPGGTRTVFNFDEVKTIAGIRAPSIDLSLIRNYFPGTVGTVAFGAYESPDYLVHPDQYIPAVGTRTEEPVVQKTDEVFFNLFLPSGPKPASGWPVAIVGHGVNGSKNDVVRLAGSMAGHGIATIAINMVGHGLGADGTLNVTRLVGGVSLPPVIFPAGGRGIDQDGNGAITTNEGSTASGSHALVLSSDAFRQTVADLMELARVIGVGMDVDADGQPDLDASRVSFVGTSWGGALGTVFVAVEPDVRLGVFAVPADSVPISFLGVFRQRAGGPSLQFRQPSLLNSPGISTFGGLALGPAYAFDDNMPLKGGLPLLVTLTDSTTRLIQSPVNNTIEGAMAIQQVTDHAEWVGETGSPAAYAPHLRRAPLSGVPAKSVLFLIGKGDQSAPNPTTTAILRAGDLADRAVWYRHDLYYAACAGSDLSVRSPHAFAVTLNSAFFGPLARAAQDTIGRFFASDGSHVTVTDPQPFIVGCTVEQNVLFEFPMPVPPPAGLNYIQ